MKKKFTLHLDAILVLVLLFVVMVGWAFYQNTQIKSLIAENQKLQWQSLADDLNLSSQASYIKKIEGQLEEAKAQ